MMAVSAHPTDQSFMGRIRNGDVNDLAATTQMPKTYIGTDQIWTTWGRYSLLYDQDNLVTVNCSQLQNLKWLQQDG